MGLGIRGTAQFHAGENRLIDRASHVFFEGGLVRPALKHGFQECSVWAIDAF
jgi:hypothetical protein